MKNIFTFLPVKRLIFSLLLGMLGFTVHSQALLENFDYTPGTLLTAAGPGPGFSTFSGAGTNVISVTTTAGLSYAGSPSSNIGGAVTLATSGEDVSKSFTGVSSGNVFTSLLINVTSAQTGGDYFYALYDGGFKARLWVKSVTGGYVFGISKNSNTVNYESTVRAYNSTFLIVLKYAFNPVATDDLVSLFVNPALGGAEPTPTIAETTSGGAADAGTIDRIAIRQGTGTTAPAVTLDGIRVGTTWSVVTPGAPTINVSPASLSGFSTSAGTASAEQSVSVNGSTLSSGITVAITAPYEVSTTATGTYSSGFTLPQTSGVVAATNVFVRIGAGAPAGNPTNGTITLTATGADNKTISLAGVVVASGVPLFTTATPLADFGSICANTTAGPNSFIINGTDLNGTDISIAALPGFSYAETAGGTFTSTLSFSYTGNGFTNKEIFVKFNPTAVQSYNGNILLSGGGLAGSYSIAATGSGSDAGPSLATNVPTSVTPTSATANGSIISNGCSAVTAYGIEYSLTSGFNNGDGTKITSTNLSGGSFSVAFTPLTPNTRYYYKAYATTASGTAYGAQVAFTAPPLPVKMSDQPELSFTEDFATIASWGAFFNAGVRDKHFVGLSSTATAPAAGIPNPTILTASSSSFGNTGFLSSGGVQRGTDQPFASPPIPSSESIVLLSTGSPDNNSSAAFDFYMDFTGLNAGVLSFDYETLNNSTGNRGGSLRVYATVNGTTYTEIVDANVLNFLNNSAISGSKTNIPLPAIFNNSATARLRFYYHNGTGGTTGSRPKISIDNLNVTAVATTPCAAPTAPASNLVFGTITDVSIAGSFTAASPAVDQYLVIASVNNALATQPVNGQIYNIGDNVGDGTVVSKSGTTSFTASGLNPTTPYYFFIYPVNSICTGGPLYYTTTPLTGMATTVAGLPNCVAPATQPTSLTVNTPTGINTISGTFTATTADQYLILVTTAASLSANPTNGTVYSIGDVVGNAKVVQLSNSTSFTANGLSPNTSYNFFVLAVNSQACVNGPVYNTDSPLTGGAVTQPLPPCTTPLTQPTFLTFNASNNKISGAFGASTSADAYLVIASTSATLSATPVNGTDYTVGAAFGGGTVVSNGAATSFLATNLSFNTIYYFHVFAANKNCSGGTLYLTADPLTGSVATTNVAITNVFFGNLHSHSDYSDGNKDNPGYTPADDYTYAKTAQCMDFLGVSEHNHFSSVNNPGNQIANYKLGIQQAYAYNAAHPDFLALYGMEWGVISGGGHMLVYGDGMDQLIGWETGSGVWGPTNNYDIYVPKSTYIGNTGIFKTVNNINDTTTTNTFVTLAHPNLTDYNNIANIPYNADADGAIAGAAVESGPSESSNTTYSDAASPMYYLWYYQTLLAKGYHLGPTVDHDNHRTTFGKTTYSRTAVIAPDISKAEIIKAMRNMHFYATQDCDIKVDFSINTKIMGTTFSDRNAPNVAVNISDITTDLSNAIIRVMYGTPGSGMMAVKVDSAIGASLKFTDIGLADLATGYYYIDISNGTSRVITSPIWYTRNDAIALPVTLSAFTAQKVNNTAKLVWATEQEINSGYFLVEKSMDGTNFSTIATVTAAGNSSSRREYGAFDNAPANGINYYRLKQVDKDGRATYSAVKSLLFSATYTVQIAPNPTRDFVHVYINKANTQAITIHLLDGAGKLLKTVKSAQNHEIINTAGFSSGLYFIKIIDGSSITTQKVLLQ